MKTHTLRRKAQIPQKGFTIIELMIATAVFSTILVMLTAIMINIGNLYYKGINQSRVQDDVRTISDEVAQHLQLSNGYTDDFATGPPNPAIPHAYCIGTTRYTYLMGVQVDTAQHALWRDTIGSGGGSCTPVSLNVAQPSPGGTELIAPRSRLTYFAITGASPYNISVGIAYGDTTLLTAPSGLGVRCVGGVGNQFCAAATLTTTVVQRLTNS